MKESWKREPWVHEGTADHNEKGNDYPENNPSEDNSRQSLGLAVFSLGPLLQPVHDPSASTRPFLLCLSAPRFTRMPTAGLKMPQFDPVISKKEP
jgi:hypothetical protein